MCQVVYYFSLVLCGGKYEKNIFCLFSSSVDCWRLFLQVIVKTLQPEAPVVRHNRRKDKSIESMVELDGACVHELVKKFKGCLLSAVSCSVVQAC